MELVTVIEIVTRPDGTKGVGNSVEVSLAEAKKLIKDDDAKHPDYPRMVLPEEWEGKKKLTTVAAVEIDDNG